MALFRWLVAVLIGSISSFAASTNDSFANRIILNGTLPTATGSFTGATSETGEPHSFNASLWWQWTPNFEGGVTVTASGTPVTPVALVYTGVWPNLTLVSGPRPGNGFPQPSKVSFYSVSNTTYYIAAAGHTNSTVGNVTVRTAAAAPADDFSRATVITGTNLISNIAVAGSTLQPGEIPSGANVVGTLWWKWTVTNSARYVIQGSVQTLPINVAVYRGDSLTNLTRIALAAYSNEILASRAIIDLDPDTYYIAIGDPGHHLGASLRIRLAPHNDDFADRIILASEATTFTSMLFTGATREPSEPGRTNGSIWWQWTAPVTGSYSVESVTGESVTAVEVFKGDSVTNLVLVSPVAPAAVTQIAGVRAQAGEVFIVRVSAPDSFAGTAPLRIRPGPTNDDFAHATSLEGGPVTTNSTFTGATFEPGEPRPPGTTGGSVWWTWLPKNSGAYSLEARSSGVNTALFAYSGGSLTNLSPQTNAYTGITSLYDPLTLRVVAGQPIHLQAVNDGFNFSAVTLSIQPGPVNDDFANALLITNDVISGTTRGASFEPGETMAGGSARGQTVWYRWKPADARGYDIQLQPPVSVGNVLTLYEGSSLTNLTLLRRVENLLPDQFSATVSPDSARTYYIAVDSLTAGGDPFSFRIIPGPANDNFDTRTHITRIDEFISGSTVGATREADEPVQGTFADRTIWYEWTAPSTGGFYIYTSTPEIPPGIWIYQGTNIASLRPVRSYDDVQPSVLGTARWTSFRAVQGEKYAIALTDHLSRGFQFQLAKGPHHDDFANAKELFLNGDAFEYSAGASLEPNEPTNNIPTGTVWHRFTAPASGTYVAIAERRITVYRGTGLGDLTQVEAFAPAFFPFTVPFRAAAGETVFISVVVAFPHGYGIWMVPGAENDDFANRLPISSSATVPYPGRSTLEPGEPPYETNFFSSLWWKWTPAASGWHRIVASTAHQGAILGLYTGTNLTELQPISVVTNAFSEESLIDVFATAGTEYAVVFNHVPVGENPLTLSIHSPPSNDSFAAPQPLTLGQTVTNVFTIATSETGETNSTAETIWYIWTAPATDTFAVVPSGDRAHVYSISVYTGIELTNLVRVASFDSPPLSPGLSFRATEGTTYRIVLGLNRSAFERSIGLTVVPGNQNDDFAERARLAGLFLSWTNDTFGATSEPHEQVPSDPQILSASIWAEWTAPQTGPFRIRPQSQYNGALNFSVYQGISITNLTLLVSSTGGATFNVESGGAYLIRISSPADATLPFTMRLGPLASNDTPATAIALEGTNVTIAGQNWTAQPWGFSASSSGTIWYAWTAPSHGLLTLRTGTNGSPAITAYHTEKPTLSSNLTERFQFARAHTNTIAVTEGVDYLFSLTALPSTNLFFNLEFEEDPVPLGVYTNALLGGHDLWFAQTNTVYSSPDALQAGPLNLSQDAWIEMVFRGPGTVRYRSKLQGQGGALRISTLPNNNSFPINFGFTQHDWTLRSNILNGATNVVRWTFSTSGRLAPLSTFAWLDDIEFVPSAPRQPRLGMFQPPAGTLSLTVQLEANRPTTIDYSTNLVDWLPWTNLLSVFNTTRSVPLQSSTNDTGAYFRARVSP